MAVDKNLATVLAADLRREWELFEEAKPDEVPYCAGFHTDDCGFAFLPFVYGEKLYEQISKNVDEDALSYLRWDLVDTEHHIQYGSYEADQILVKRPDIYSFDDESGANKETSIRMNSAFTALKELEQDGLFGIGKAREKITLLIMASDIEENFVLRWAKKLNPRSVYKAFKASYVED